MIETETLIAQRDAIPLLIDHAVENADAQELINLRRRKDDLDLQIIAEELAATKQTIKAKEAERIDVDHQLSDLGNDLTAAKQIYDGRLEQLEAAWTVHAQLQLRAGVLDDRKQMLFEDLSILKQELADLKNKLRNDDRGKHNEIGKRN